MDLCIVGAGPAGIAIAIEFVGTPWKVCLLESGGLNSEHDSQALSEGLSVGPCELDPATSRLRAFGGAARLWGGGVIPLSSLEMARRDWVPESGWPIDRDELAPYYDRANKACRVEPSDLEDGAYRLAPGSGHDAPLPANLDSRTSRVTRLDYRHAHVEQLRAAPNLRLVLHANLLRFEAVDNATAVRRALIGGLDGRRGSVNARFFVLATGGIENARLLLQSDDVARNGLGNDHDLVGRYFMDHPRCGLGTFRAGGIMQLERYDRPLDRAASPAFRQFSISDHAQRTHRLLNARIWPFPLEGPVPAGLRSLRALRTSLRPGAYRTSENERVEHALLDALSQDLPVCPPTPPEQPNRVQLALDTTLHAGHVLRAGCRKLARRPAVDIDRIEMVGYFEQAPNRDSRVSLSEQRDALGQRKVQVDWRLSDIDEASIRTTADLMGRDMAAHFKCDFEPAEWLRNATRPRVHGTAHHLGTTRMSDSPRTGVVDRHCRVHGVDNLYVAGSSVFPTGGWAFPTLTIVALALRISDELRTRMSELSTMMML